MMQADRPLFALAALRLAKVGDKARDASTEATGLAVFLGSGQARPAAPIVFASAQIGSTRAFLPNPRRNVRYVN